MEHYIIIKIKILILEINLKLICCNSGKKYCFMTSFAQLCSACYNLIYYSIKKTGGASISGMLSLREMPSHSEILSIFLLLFLCSSCGRQPACCLLYYSCSSLPVACSTIVAAACLLPALVTTAGLLPALVAAARLLPALQ